MRRSRWATSVFLPHKTARRTARSSRPLPAPQPGVHASGRRGRRSAAALRVCPRSAHCGRHVLMIHTHTAHRAPHTAHCTRHTAPTLAPALAPAPTRACTRTHTRHACTLQEAGGLRVVARAADRTFVQSTLHLATNGGSGRWGAWGALPGRTWASGPAVLPSADGGIEVRAPCILYVGLRPPVQCSARAEECACARPRVPRCSLHQQCALQLHSAMHATVRESVQCVIPWKQGAVQIRPCSPARSR